MRTLSTSRIAPSSPDSFYVAGCDLGKKHDFTVVAVVEKRGQELFLVYLKRFPLGTEYNSVVGFLRLLNERLRDLRRILIDQTGVGETFVEDVVVRAGLKNARGGSSHSDEEERHSELPETRNGRWKTPHSI